MLDCLAEIRKGGYTTFSLLLRQCPWPLDSLQGPDEGLGFPGSICVGCVFTRSLRSTSETKVGTAWCNKAGVSLCFFFFLFLGLHPIFKIQYQHLTFSKKWAGITTCSCIFHSCCCSVDKTLMKDIPNDSFSH